MKIIDGRLVEIKSEDIINGTCVIPKSVNEIASSKVFDLKIIENLIFRGETLRIRPNIFNCYCSIKNIYCSKEIFSKFKDQFCHISNVTVFIMDIISHDLVQYKNIPFKDNLIYKAQAVYINKNVISCISYDHYNFSEDSSTCLEKDGTTKVFDDIQIGDCNYIKTASEIYFHVKIDKDGYPYAEELCTKEILPIIGYKNDRLFVSSFVKNITIAITYSTISLARQEEIASLDKLSRLKKKKYQNFVTKLATSFKLINVPEFDYEKEVILNQNSKTNLITEIRKQLFSILDINVSEYQKYNKLFQDILTSGSDELTIQSKLIELSAVLEYKNLFKEISLSSSSSLIDNIEAMSNNYYDRLANNASLTEDKVFDPKKIDMLAKFFISIKDSLNYLELDNISKNIAFMYFAEIKLYLENTKDININIVNNKYIKYFTSYIYFIIKILLINGYIETDVQIDLENINLIELIDSIDISKLKVSSKKKVLSFDKVQDKKEE